MKYIKSALAILLVVMSLSAFAQTKPVVKFKPPALTSVIGGYKDSALISVAEAERIVGEKIYITDNKKVVYTISSYQFAYRKIGVTEDEQTGKVTPTKTLVSNLFRTSPLPEIWVKQMKEQVKPGDEIWFFDVIAKDAQGRVMYAPDIKFTIKN